MSSNLVIGITFTIAVFALAAIVHMRLRNPKIRGSALTGTARVLSTNQTTGPGGEHGSLALRIGLRVEIPGRQPYDVTVKRSVDLNHLGRLQIGATIPVQVDATDPQKVRIDFSQPIT
jgi:hypothetical protein